MASTPLWRKLAIILYLSAIHLLALFFVLEKWDEKKERDVLHSQQSPGIDSPGLLATPQGTSAPPANSGSSETAPSSYQDDSYDTGKLMIPVAGVKRMDLQDTYTQSRSGGRVHNAIDIMAGEGTPVVAVADGEIAKLFDSQQGGITIYQWGEGRKRVYYYAHLQRRAEGISEKSFVKRGTIIGYVGNTGNAGPGNYHLHFAITLPISPDRHWEGTDINPYPLLKEGIEIPSVRE